MEQDDSMKVQADTLDPVLMRHRAIKSYIDRFWVNLSKCGKDKMSPEYLRARLELLARYWSQFEEGHYRLLEHAGVVATSEELDNLFMAAEASFVDAQARIRFALLEQAPASSSSSPSAPSGSAPLAPKLPALSIPPFSGVYTEWRPFRDLFTSIIRNHGKLSNVEKLHYLRTCLVGEAAQVVENLALSDDSYELAWKLLEERYENRRVLLNRHLDHLCDPTPTSGRSAQCLNELLHSVDRSLAGILSLGLPTTVGQPLGISGGAAL